ncbi:tyrosine-type recombinase/integrase [Paracoccus sp. DMF-8]|uniref:tyrosine-type recombinase/integrase n=1 Tax=Paracoccus sp. DMF-8 TaxID=3019445 RepID=UPI0023E8C334|nr:tyrosine-type recombinase/integrase [Paracoccus sp. DMF-8]MDF3606515.1 tyrosine-type recombinase/integrase [Paracoccus sp. DMF-8]
MSNEMKVTFPGLYSEKRGAKTRYVVRKEGDKTKKITLAIDPSHPKFAEHYHAARSGIRLDPEPVAAQMVIRGSIGWLVDLYIAEMERAVASGQMHKSTCQQRSVFLTWMRAEVGEYGVGIPQTQLILLRDMKASTPGAADNFIKAVRAMFTWAVDRNLAKANPATGIKKINEGTGARAWTVADLEAYRKRHPFGSMAHLALTLFMFTACRIGDVVTLGRQHEVKRANGSVWLGWQPEKRGSKKVVIPILPPLLKAVRAQSVIGRTYLLREDGKPFASKNSFGNKFSTWMDQAGLVGLSAHGIRKAAGELLALHGASQYHIMAVHGHASAKTSEIYTEGADRARLAEQAMQMLSAMDW